MNLFCIFPYTPGMFSETSERICSRGGHTPYYGDRNLLRRTAFVKACLHYTTPQTNLSSIVVVMRQDDAPQSRVGFFSTCSPKTSAMPPGNAPPHSIAARVLNVHCCMVPQAPILRLENHRRQSAQNYPIGRYVKL